MPPNILLDQTVTEIYREHHRWLTHWLNRKLGNSFDAADLAQDTFTRLLKSSKVLSLGNESRAFLTHIAKGLVIDHWRRLDVENAYLEAIAHLPAATAPSPETRALIIETLLQIETMLAKLSPRTREIFLLAQVDQLTLAQIADQVNVPVITVRRHIQKALLTCMTVL